MHEPRILKDFMLPIAMATGIAGYLVYHFTPALRPAGPILHEAVSVSQPVLIGVMLLLQFNKISPHDLKVRKWHLKLLLVQAVLFILTAVAAALMPEGNPKILVECAMLCFICPTAAAAGVITDKLGGSLSEIMTYVVLINCMAAILIPALLPFVHTAEEVGFFAGITRIASRIFPVLLLPCLLAWIIRYTARRLQKRLMRIAGWAFYIWGVTLALSLTLATRAMLLSGISVTMAILIAAISLFCCIFQFMVGRLAGKREGQAEALTAGQALGQKNTGVLIWIGYSFLTPVTAMAGGLYSIWHNIVNSYELYRRSHGK